MAIIFARVTSVRYNAGDFYILAAEVAQSHDPKVNDRVTTCRGHLVGLIGMRYGVTIQLIGEWVQHSRYGRQFEIRGWRPWTPRALDAQTFLMTCINGFQDEAMTRDIVRAYAEDTLKVLAEEPDRVLEDFSDRYPVENIERALFQWDLAKGAYELTLLLSHHNIPSHVLSAIVKRHGSEAREIVANNPYRLMVVEGVTFAIADRIATALGVGTDDPRRYEGAVLWILREAVAQGHLYARRQSLSSTFLDLLHSESVTFSTQDLQTKLIDAVDRLQSDRAIVSDEEGVYLPSYYTYERKSAEALARFLALESKLEVDLDVFLGGYEKQFDIDLSAAQKEAVDKITRNKVVVVTGLPGTGKTTVIKTFVRLFSSSGVSFKLMAPTGIAAKRLESVTGYPAATIHRTLQYDGVNWGQDSSNRLVTDAVILDECSMVDQELFYRLLEALDPRTILVIVGDDAQLPSVGPGNVLRELMRSPIIPKVRLTEIFRQSKTSEIVVNSHRINRGDMVTTKNAIESEFQFVEVKDEARIVDIIVQMALKLKGRDENFQVLAPKYDGTVGVRALNDALREHLNPSQGQAELKLGDLHIRVGDRVMVIRNDYDKNVYNGDMGKVASISNGSVNVKIHGGGVSGTDAIVTFEKNRVLEMLRLAYAITIHKSQGSEFGTVILPVVSAQGRMLQRNLLYTGVTRAKRKVWLLGEPAALARAIANDKTVSRNTALGKSVEKALEGVQAANPALK